MAECASRLVGAGCVDLMSVGQARQMDRDREMIITKERRGRSEERPSSSFRALQHRVQAPLPASRTSSRTLSSSNSAPALLVPVRAVPHVPSPLSMPSSRSPSRSRPYDDEDEVDSPTSSVSSSSSSSSSSTDSADDADRPSSPFTPPHVLPSAYHYPGSATTIPKLMLPPPIPSHHQHHLSHHGQHKRSHAHARIAPYPTLSLPPTRTSSPATSASTYAYAVPAPPPVTATLSASGSMVPKLLLPPPGTHGLYPSCIMGVPYAS